MPIGNKTNMIAGLYTAFDFEQLTISSTVVSLTSSVYAPDSSTRVKRATITFYTAPTRIRYDGGDPTSTTGHVRNPTDVLILVGYANISNFRAIRTGSTDGQISVTYEY